MEHWKKESAAVVCPATLDLIQFSAINQINQFEGYVKASEYFQLSLWKLVKKTKDWLKSNCHEKKICFTVIVSALKKSQIISGWSIQLH